MVEAGMPPMFVLQAATTHAARTAQALDGHRQHRSRQVRRHRRASNGNPLDDITRMQQVDFVMKGGVVFKDTRASTGP